MRKLQDGTLGKPDGNGAHAEDDSMIHIGDISVQGTSPEAASPAPSQPTTASKFGKLALAMALLASGAGGASLPLIIQALDQSQIVAPEAPSWKDYEIGVKVIPEENAPIVNKSE